jgi:G3E family GTPase
VIIHGVQHTIHPPTHLDAWPDGVKRTSLIFIAKGLVRARFLESLEAFNQLAVPGSNTSEP